MMTEGLLRRYDNLISPLELARYVGILPQLPVTYAKYKNPDHRHPSGLGMREINLLVPLPLRVQDQVE